MSEFLKLSFCTAEKRKKNRIFYFIKICVIHKDVFMRECSVISHMAISKLKHLIESEVLKVGITYLLDAQRPCKMLGRRKRPICPSFTEFKIKFKFS